MTHTFITYQLLVLFPDRSKSYFWLLPRLFFVIIRFVTIFTMIVIHKVKNFLWVKENVTYLYLFRIIKRFLNALIKVNTLTHVL